MINQRNIQTGESGFSLMEITLAMFVLVFGLLGILAVFPVGLDSSRKSIENTTAALIGKSVLEYLRVDGTLSTIADPDGNGTDDNYAPWPDFEQPSLSSGSTDESGVITAMGSISTLTCKRSDGTTDPAWPTVDGAARWIDHILMLTTGAFKGKVYQISTNTTTGTLTLTQPVLDDAYSGNLNLDLIEQGTHFVILGKVTNTIPQDFFSVTPNLRLVQYERLETDANGDSNADYAIPDYDDSESDYSYVCILSGHLPGSPNTAQATILVYKNYVDFHTATTQRPEQNQPPVTYFTTILTR